MNNGTEFNDLYLRAQKQHLSSPKLGVFYCAYSALACVFCKLHSCQRSLYSNSQPKLVDNIASSRCMYFGSAHVNTGSVAFNYIICRTINPTAHNFNRSKNMPFHYFGFLLFFPNNKPTKLSEVVSINHCAQCTSAILLNMNGITLMGNFFSPLYIRLFCGIAMHQNTLLRFVCIVLEHIHTFVLMSH